ncbi:DnaA regulatory inactivator Hda [Acidithiobacillus marinus]|uniref:DnaA regulatory inactivator Hda n=1 Tax=Acidithiobacillus marinus TaxID=187490 RepID=A0A2I1DMN9_9PROT|nr:DnaA regulatory inactivator Hda [Acidithiobacillus marinus]PKY11146.1 DnaA regulatory inactivator Hda [Acidithiobacillus marinus]
MKPFTGAPGQLLLPLGLKAAASLETFYRAANGAALDAVRSLLQQPSPVFGLYLHGPAGVGKSHLLQGAAQFGPSWVPYLDCAVMGEEVGAFLLPDAFASLIDAPLVCLDNVDVWVGGHDREMFLYGLYNERFQRGRPLLLAGRESPRQLPWILPDWASRVTACLQIALQLPDDAERLQILQAMALRRGLRMDEEVARYMLRHQTRDMGALELLLEKLDAHSWAQQRQLTIPFVRHCLETEAGV